MILNKLIENLGQEGELTRCEKVLGDLSRVYRIADFWENNADLIEIIAANELLNFATIERYNTEEMTAFRRGLKSMGIFMSECASERQRIEAMKVAESRGDSQ